jgi:hypothetical protein
MTAFTESVVEQAALDWLGGHQLADHPRPWHRARHSRGRAGRYASSPRTSVEPPRELAFSRHQNQRSADARTIFDTSTRNVSLRLKNIFANSELEASATTEDSSVVQSEGNRRVRRQLLLTAESAPKDKEPMIRLVMNMLARPSDG